MVFHKKKMKLLSGDDMPELKKQKKRKAFKIKQKVFRSSDPLLSVFMWGVHHSVSQLQHTNIPRLLLPADFKAFSKVSMENYNFNTENMCSKFKFKEYCPLVFRDLRERFCVKENVFNQALSGMEPCYDPQENAKYFYSKDGQFVVKLFHSEEVEFMHSILGEYHSYIVEMSGKTLLPHYLAMYRITVSGVEHYMIVMKNIFSADGLTIHRRYDLKGSLVDREASEKVKAQNNPTLKDVDFLKDEIKIKIGSDKKEEMMAILERDVNFLSTLKIMDYSMLVGIHNVGQPGLDEEDEEEEEQSSSDDLLEGEEAAEVPMECEAEEEELEPMPNVYAYVSTEAAPSKELYFVGLIDVLTKYNASKRAAHTAKTMKHGAGAEISTVKPEQYAKRFIDFMNNAFE